MFPSIRIKHKLEDHRVKQFFLDFEKSHKEFDWVVFLSTNAVRIFAKGLEENSLLKAFPFGRPQTRPRLCSVGPQTSQTINEYGWALSREAKVFNTKGFLVF